jgi:hypothetical protein
MSPRITLALLVCSAFVCSAFVACSAPESHRARGNPGTGGSTGPGAGGSVGTAGATAGASGDSGQGGTTGLGGDPGTGVAGTTGMGGDPGAGTAGVMGNGGTTGNGGAGGDAAGTTGNGGTGGSAGTTGNGGTGGSAGTTGTGGAGGAAGTSAGAGGAGGGAAGAGGAGGAGGDGGAAGATGTGGTFGAGAVLRIDSGSLNMQGMYVADEFFTPTPGQTTTHVNTIDMSGVSNPAPEAVYQSSRQGTFTYTLTGFTANTSHTMRLHFCETYFPPAGDPMPTVLAGRRLCNISVNGTIMLMNYDILAKSGAKNKAVAETLTANASGTGQFVLQFTPTKDNCFLAGIEIQ